MTTCDTARLVTFEVECPIGILRGVVSERGLVRLQFPGSTGDDGVSPEELRTARRDDGHPWAAQIREYFAGARTRFDLPVDLSRTRPFARRVLEELYAVPFGETVTYGDLARRVGSPRAARAVGGVMASNPVAVVVPCHRVLPSGGGLGGFGGGLPAKRTLLSHEGAAFRG